MGKIKYTTKEVEERLGGMINGTWAELKALRDEGKLIAGMKYRMIDYDTYTSQEGTSSAMHPFDLILTALDESHFSEECSAIQSARDVDGYFANSNLGAWKVWYCLDNDVYRFSWAARKGLVWDMEDMFIYFFYNGEYIYNQNTYHRFSFDLGKMEGLPYTMWVHLLFLTENISVGDTAEYVLMEAEGVISDATSDMGSAVVNSVSVFDGKGVIYRMIDDSNNDCPYDFKNIKHVQGTYSYYTFTNGYGEYDTSTWTNTIPLSTSRDNTIKVMTGGNTIYTGRKLPIIWVANWEGQTGNTIIGNVWDGVEESKIHLGDATGFINNVIRNSSVYMMNSSKSNSFYRVSNCIIENSKISISSKYCTLTNAHFRNLSNYQYSEEKLSITVPTTITSNSQGDIVQYTDEDIYNAITATKTK